MFKIVDVQGMQVQKLTKSSKKDYRPGGHGVEQLA